MRITHTAEAGGQGDLTPLALAELVQQLGAAGVPPDAAITVTTTDSQADGTNWSARIGWVEEQA